jgi:oligopeptide transport system substrate-binding protein
VWAGAAWVLVGCSAGDSSTSTLNTSIQVGSALARDQTLSRSLDDEPRSLDPLLGTDVPSQRIADDLFEGLTTVDVAGRAAAGVATSWQSSADGRTWTFHLRPEVRWSNGAPLTAADFVYSWRREVDPHTGAQYAQALAPIEHALAIASGEAAPETLGVEALDAHTLRLHLAGPTPYLLELLAQQYMYPVYAPAIERYQDLWVQPEHLVCNGPFVLREHVIGSRITLEKNPRYWDTGHVQLQRVIYYVAPDRAVQATRFMAGAVQWTDSFAANQRAFLLSRLGTQVVNSPYLGTFMLGFNAALPPFKGNRALREALVLALDREPLVHYLRFGMYQPAYTLMPPLPDYEQPLPEWRRLSDEARHALALRLYHEAGYSAAHPLRIDIDTSLQGADERHFFEAVAASWHSLLGAQVHVDEREFKVLIQDRLLHKLPLFFDAWIGDYPDPYTFLQLFYTANGNNNTGYSNPRFDQLLDAAARQADNAQRYRLFEQAEQLLNDDVCYLPLYYYATRHLVKPYLRGWQSNIMDRNLSRYMYLLEHRGA